MKKILIIQTSFIGDVILATSMIETLTAEFQEKIDIELLVRKGNEGLLLNHPAIGKVHVWDKKSNKYKNLFRLIKNLSQTSFDRVYNLQRFASTGFLTWRLKSEQKIGFVKNPFSFSFDRKIAHEIGNGKHEIFRNFELLRADVSAEMPAMPKLYPNQKDQEIVDNLLIGIDNFHVLAPASVWFTKQAPKSKWIELLQLFKTDGKTILIGGPNDSDLISEIIVESGVNNALNFAGKLSLLQSAALIKMAARTFVNDSAPLHIASAMNAPVTAFFCSTIPEFGFGPLSTDYQLIQSKLELKCRPCGLHGFKSCPEGHFKCGTSLVINSK